MTSRPPVQQSSISYLQRVPWKKCQYCGDTEFISPKDFTTHLRLMHCKREGGSYICLYGDNSLCKYLPIEGVNDVDYERHVSRFHTSVVSPRDEQRRGATAASNTTDQPPASKDGCKPKKKWTVYDAKVNMAALLNDPRPGKRQPDFFSKTWGAGWDYLDLSPHPEVAKITADHFQKYLKRVIQKLPARHKKRSVHFKSPPSRNAESSDSDAPTTRKPDHHIQSEISKVPTLYFSPNFTLSDERMFNQVLPVSDIYQLTSTNPFSATLTSTNQKSATSKRLLQEQLTHYLDVVEVQIARQVSMKSDSFFSVITQHSNIHLQITTVTDSITQLRNNLARLEKLKVESPMLLLRKAQRKERLMAVSRKIRVIATLHQAQPTVQMLLSSSDYVGALDVIFMAQETLSRELPGMTAFRHMSSQLSEVEKYIEQMVKQEYIAFITTHLDQPLAEEPFPIDQDRFVSIFLALLKQNTTDFIDLYQQEIQSSIKAIVKQTVIEYVSAAERNGPDTGSTLADQMRLLRFDTWLGMMEDIFKNLLTVIARVKDMIQLMDSFSQSAAGLYTQSDDDILIMPASESSISEDYYKKLNTSYNQLIVRVCDLCSDRCAKVVNARSKDMFIEKLTSKQFFKLMSAVEKFTRSCDELSNHQSNNSLRGCLQGHSINFINKFHEERKNKLNKLLDFERWRSYDIPRDFQSLVTHCEMCGQLNIPENFQCETGEPYDVLKVNNSKYAIISTVVALIKMIIEYCSCLEDFPKSAQDILTRLIELLRLFNSRSSQLILGAGAVQQVGLRTITARNIALLLSCLSLIQYYIPKIHDHFSVYIHKQSLLRHVDTCYNDYQQHANTVLQKLQILASEMIKTCVNQWEIRAPMPSECFRILCRQLNKFNEATQDALQSNQIKVLFKEVETILKQKLRERLKSLNMFSLTGPQQGLIMSDLAYFVQSTANINLDRRSLIQLTITDIT